MSFYLWDSEGIKPCKPEKKLSYGSEIVDMMVTRVAQICHVKSQRNTMTQYDSNVFKFCKERFNLPPSLIRYLNNSVFNFFLLRETPSEEARLINSSFKWWYYSSLYHIVIPKPITIVYPSEFELVPLVEPSQYQLVPLVESSQSELVVVNATPNNSIVTLKKVCSQTANFTQEKVLTRNNFIRTVDLAVVIVAHCNGILGLGAIGAVAMHTVLQSVIPSATETVSQISSHHIEDLSELDVENLSELGVEDAGELDGSND